MYIAFVYLAFDQIMFNMFRDFPLMHRHKHTLENLEVAKTKLGYKDYINKSKDSGRQHYKARINNMQNAKNKGRYIKYD